MQLPPFSVTPLTVIKPGKLNAEEFKSVRGNYWYLVRASHPRFMISINESPYVPSDLGTGDIYPLDFKIEVIRIWNTDPAIPLEILLKTGEGSTMDNRLLVYQNEIAPMIRPETPPLLGEAVSVEGAGGFVINVWKKILEADATRAEVWLSTNAAALAYWGKDAAADETASRNIVESSGIDGFVKLNTSAAIWVKHKEAGKEIRALTFGY